MWAILNPRPVVNAVSESKAKVATAPPVLTNVTREPDVVVVSTEDEDRLNKEPPPEITEVACNNFIPKPVVKAAAVPKFRSVPVVTPEPTIETTFPVVVIVPEEVTSKAFPVVRALEVIFTVLPAVVFAPVTSNVLEAPVVEQPVIETTFPV